MRALRSSRKGSALARGCSLDQSKRFGEGTRPCNSCSGSKVEGFTETELGTALTRAGAIVQGLNPRPHRRPVAILGECRMNAALLPKWCQAQLRTRVQPREQGVKSQDRGRRGCYSDVCPSQSSTPFRP